MEEAVMNKKDDFEVFSVALAYLALIFAVAYTVYQIVVTFWVKP